MRVMKKMETEVIQINFRNVHGTIMVPMEDVIKIVRSVCIDSTQADLNELAIRRFIEKARKSNGE